MNGKMAGNKGKMGWIILIFFEKFVCFQLFAAWICCIATVSLSAMKNGAANWLKGLGKSIDDWWKWIDGKGRMETKLTLFVHLIWAPANHCLKHQLINWAGFEGLAVKWGVILEDHCQCIWEIVNLCFCYFLILWEDHCFLPPFTNETRGVLVS